MINRVPFLVYVMGTILGGLLLTGISQASGGDAVATPAMIDSSPDVSFVDPSVGINTLWADLWGTSYQSNISSMVLNGQGPNFAIIAGSTGDPNFVEGAYIESVRLTTDELSVDVSTVPEIASFKRFLSAGIITGSTGYSTPLYGYIIEVIYIEQVTGTLGERLLRTFAPFEVSDSLSGAVMSAADLYGALLNDADFFKIPSPSDPCVQACQDAWKLKLAANRLNGVACMGACASVAIGGLLLCTGATIGFPICAGAVLLAQGLCEGACFLNFKANNKIATAELIECVANCSTQSSPIIYAGDLQISLL